MRIVFELITTESPVVPFSFGTSTPYSVLLIHLHPFLPLPDTLPRTRRNNLSSITVHRDKRQDCISCLIRSRMSFLATHFTRSMEQDSVSVPYALPALPDMSCDSCHLAPCSGLGRRICCISCLHRLKLRQRYLRTTRAEHTKNHHDIAPY